MSKNNSVTGSVEGTSGWRDIPGGCRGLEQMCVVFSVYEINREKKKKTGVQFTILATRSEGKRNEREVSRNASELTFL